MIQLLFLLVACGDREPAPPPAAPEPVVVPPPAEPAVPVVPPSFEAHEWGLIGMMVGGERAVAVAGAARARPIGDLIEEALGNDSPLGLSGMHVSGGKPVVYFHTTSEMQISAAIHVPGGRMIEVWPPVDIAADPTRAAFPDLRIRPGACNGTGFPSPADGACQTSDGYCEAIELARYETTDAACITAGARTLNHLFYRADLDRTKLPLDVHMQGRRVVVSHRGTAPIPGVLMHVAGRTDAEATARITLVPPPAPGAEITIEGGETATPASFDEALHARLRELGMSEPEAASFLTAWRADLVGGCDAHPARPSANVPPELAPAREALLYFLDEASLTAMAPLTFAPAPSAVRRAMMVRITIR